ncbi:hypothetical protein [Spongiimicrobium sp. 3-5]|uniref:hypothetical protein n=1 Tax=Spongiimicrobium sp. 3-5 TaxID=3332596 RepID=UPI003981706C
MKLFRQVFDFYLDASIHVAFSVVSLVYITTRFLSIPVDMHLAYFIFFSTICCYNFIKYGVEAEKYLVMTNLYHKYIQFISLAALAVALYHGYFLSGGIWLAIVALVGVVALYAMPVLPKAKNLRSLGGFKIFLVALVWSGITVALPALKLYLTMPWDLTLVFFQRFLLVLILMLPFEIRDLKYDVPELRTLPQRFGVQPMKRLGILLVAVFFLLTFFRDEISFLEISGRFFLSLILIMVLLITSKEQPKYFASFWVEAVPIFWLGILWGFGIILGVN